MRRRGTSTTGCLFPLLALVVAAYVGRPFGEAYFRYYQYRDAMSQEARFSNSRSDDVITGHLRNLADSLELPRNAAFIGISRTPDGVKIWSDYDEIIELPFKHEKTVHFHPTSGKSF